MLQLKPGLRRPTLRRGPKATLYDLKFFYQIGDPYRLKKANKFPFNEAIPLYLSSQLKSAKPKVHQFLQHNLNKKLNKYYNTGEIGSTSLMKKYKEAWKMMGLRDIIKGFEREDEIYSLKNYWLFKLYPYYDRKFIEEFSKKCPRLKEFVQKRRKGDIGRLQFFKRYMSAWTNPQDKTAKEKWLLKRFQKELDFSKKQTKYLNVYLETFMGSKRYKEEKMNKLHRGITILNMFYNVFGTEIDKELKGMLEKDKKLSKLNDETKREKVLTLVIRAKPKFDERQALHSICKKHFKEIYCPPKLPVKQEKILTRENFMQENRMKIKRTIKLPGNRASLQQYAFKGKFFVKADMDDELLEGIKNDLRKKGIETSSKERAFNHDVAQNVRTEIMPHTLPDYEMRLHKTQRPKRIDGFMKFFEDFQGLLMAKDEEIVRKPSNELKLVVSVTDFVRPKEHIEEEVLETSVSSFLTIPGDSSVDEEEEHPSKQPDEEEKENQPQDERMSSAIVEQDEGEKPKQSHTEEQTVKKGRWRLLSIKKATYIILRFLHDMTKQRYLPDKKKLEDTTSEHSSLSPPPSVKVQVPPILALKSILTEKKSEKISKPSMQYLEECAKNLYMKIRARQRRLLLDKCKLYGQMFSDKYGIPNNDFDVINMIDKWRSDEIMHASWEQQDVSSLSTCYSESSQSFITEKDPTMFDHAVLKTKGKKSNHVEVLSLFLLFLNVAKKIMNVRKALQEYKDTRNAPFQKRKSKIKGQRAVKKKKKDSKIVSLPNFRKFLEKNYGLYDVNEYIALAQRYCPDYEFYERKKDIKRPPPPKAAGSGEELGIPAQVKETKSVYFKEESVSVGKSMPYTEDEAEKLEREKKELRKRFIEDKSYISWKGPPCEDDFSTKTRVYFMKHSTEWAPFPDFSDISIDKKFISSPFFEFPTALAIPRLVSRYYRHLPALKLPDTYILDPPPDSLKWDRTCWMETEKKIPYYEKYDKDFPWMYRYFNFFWLSEDKKELTKEEIQKKMFSSWCGNLFLLADDSVKFFSKLCEAIDVFEKENKGVKKIYNAADACRYGQQTWEWMKMNKYLENVSPIDLLGIHKWSRELNQRYNEADFKEESSATGFQSFSSSRVGSFKESSVDIVPDRAQEKVDEPKDFPIQDFKSLKEVLVSFIELVKKFKSYRIAPYGENYRPITEYYLKCITEECGFVDTSDEPSDHPNIRLVPARAICYNDKEKQFYYHSNNFIDTLQKKYPQRFLKMPFHVRNEYGSMKHICTFISTRRLSFPELNTWKGCMRTVANKLECIPLNDGNRPPRMVKSPFTTMQDRKGNVFELSILLTGFLIAAGYDAYCVCGTATYHRAFYGNTDDVSPDESDIEPPSTNRYKQCNMLPPFSSRWYRDSAAYHDPIPYEEMEVCKVNRNKKKIFQEHYSTWPKTDQEILAEYSKELVEKPRHKSRFDNPAIPLPCNWKKEETSEEEETDEEKLAMRKLDEAYNKLVAERGKREEEERRKEEEKKKSMRTYIQETPSDPKSQFVEKKMRRERFEMEMKREESKRSKGKSQFMEEQLEELKYFSWLYGPNGPHPEYSEMLRKDRKRLKQVSDLPEINLLQFMEFYDPTKHRLEVLTGEKLHYYDRDSLRCKRKLKSINEKLWEMDMNRLERIKMRRAQYKKADESEQKKKQVESENASDSLSRIMEAKARRAKHKRKVKPRAPKTATAKEIKVNASVTAVTHRQKLLQSPFIRKLWMNLSAEFPNTHMFKRIKESMGFKPKQLRRHRDPDLKLEDFAQVIKLLEGTYYLKHLNPATLQFIEPILQKVSSQMNSSRMALESLMKARSKRMHRRKIKKTREKKLLQKKPYIPNRIHCWVLIRDGARNVKKPFFIDVFTGVPYPVDDGNYLKISCVWNDKNYYIPRYVATHHHKTREFDFRNNEYWFHLLPLEPMSSVVEKKRKPWWWEIKGHPHVLQHIEMPPYWGRRVRVPALEWDKMFPNTNKKTFYYKRTTIEVYDRDGRPADGLEKRISKFLDMRKTILESVDTKYEMRKDRLMWRHFDVNSGFVEERFEEGRPDHLKCYRFLAYLLPGLYTPKEFQFYGKRRDDKLSNLLISDKYMVAEFKEGRMDHLKRVKYCYSKKKTDQRLFVIDEYSKRVKRICARYRRLSFQFEPWKQYFKEFSEIPIKLEINMNSMFSEYWYWDEKLLAPVKWVAEHLDEESTGFAKSKKINQFLDTEPILYGIGRTLEDTHSQFIKRKERYEKRESDDRIYLMSVARVLEEVVCNTLVQREYEKIMDVLRGADELKRLNINSEKALDTMKTYFEAEREMLQRDFESTKAKKGLGSFFHCDDDTVLENLFNNFINEQYWVRFVVASWDELNKIFRRAMEERKKASPIFQGYSDLLASIVRCHSHGIGLTETTIPPLQKGVLDFELIQAQLPLGAAYRKLVDLRRDMCEVKSEDDINNHKIERKDIKTSNRLETQDKTCDENVVSETTALESSVTALTSSQKIKGEKQKKCKKNHVDKKKDNLKKCKSGTTKSGATINSGKECTTLAKDEKKDYTSIDVEKHYLMKKWLLQMVKFLTPKEYHDLLKIKSSPNVGWNKYFVDVFNAFANEVMSREKQNKTEKEEEILELIDHQHPHRAHLRHHEKVLVALKKLEPNKRLTLEERDEIVNIYNRSRKTGNFEEEDVSDLINIFAKRQNYCQLENQNIQDFIMCFLDHKRAEVIEQPRRNKIVAGKKMKIKKRPLELNFTFENAPSNVKECSFSKCSDGKFKNIISGGQTKIKRDAPIDHYKLFVHKYRKVSDSVKGLRNFLSDLGYRPRLSLIAESLIDSQKNQPVFSFELFKKKVLPKERSIKPKLKYGFDGSGDRKLQSCYVDGHYNYNNRFYMYDDIWKDDWMEGNVASGLLPFTTTNFAKTDVGVVDVIDLFSKPSELQFVQRKNEKVFTLQPTLRKEEVKIFNEEAEKEFKQLFMNDYSYIELCEERIPPFLDVPSDPELEIGKSLERTDEQEEERILKAHSKIPVDKEHLKIISIEPLRKMPLGIAVKSCPHCINVYYQANKERLDMLQYIQTQRDIHTAYCMTRPGKQHLPPNVLEEHRNKIQFFEKYIEYLQNDSSVYNSYGKKIVADECRQYKFFIELLNYKVIYDYFPLNALYRKYRYETRPWSIYPEEFEFAEAKPYEKMMLSGKVKQIVPRENPETLGEVQTVEPVPFYHSAEHPKPLIRMPSYPELPPLEELLKGDKKKTKHRSLTTTLPEKHIVDIFPEQRKSVPAVVKTQPEERMSLLAETKGKKKKPYPEIDSKNPTQVELYRDVRPKKEHTKPYAGFKQLEVKGENNRPAYTTVTKRIWK